MIMPSVKMKNSIDAESEDLYNKNLLECIGPKHLPQWLLYKIIHAEQLFVQLIVCSLILHSQLILVSLYPSLLSAHKTPLFH